jgi:hypothetical protein
MNKNKIFLLVVGLWSLITAVDGWYYYFQGRDVFSIVTWPFVPIGIFVWGDGMVLGALLFLASAWLWFKNDSVWTGLFFLSMSFCGHFSKSSTT